MHLHVLWLMIAMLTKSIASGELSCSITTTGNGTFYKILLPDLGNAHCGPQWNDADNNILANSDGKNDTLVVSSNITTLHTYACHNTVMYVLDCYPSQNKNVTCVANCSESAGISDTPGNKGTRNHWVVLAIVFGIFLVISGVIYYRSRQRRNQSEV